MDLRLVEIFCCVYEEKSFSKAAERLGLTQPTISGHIKALEEYFEAPLFDRLGRAIGPTAAGDVLYEHGRRIVEMKRVTIEAMDCFFNRLEGRLRLGASTIPGEHILPAIIGRFREAYPRIQVSLAIHDTREIVDWVTRGEVELGFVGAQLANPRLEFREFTADRLMLVAPPTAFWEPYDQGISLDELRKAPLLLREPGSGTRMILEQRLFELGHRLDEFQVVAELGSTTAIKEAVKAGLGASFVSSLSVEDELKEGWMRRIPTRIAEELKRSFYRVTNVERSSSPLREAFLAYLSLDAEEVARGAGQ
ncbi:MAG: LysR family transcriptional regulator [bacterium]|nr:LysR family transcriptional regulator [bacterium]